MIAGEREAWGEALYPDLESYPHLYETDDETIDTPPFGSITSVDFPTTMNDTFFEVHPPNLHLLLQEWVNAPDYVEGDPVGFYVVPTSDSSIDVSGRSWDNMELVVEFRPRNVYVVT